MLSLNLTKEEARELEELLKDLGELDLDTSSDEHIYKVMKNFVSNDILEDIYDKLYRKLHY